MLPFGWTHLSGGRGRFCLGPRDRDDTGAPFLGGNRPSSQSRAPNTHEKEANLSGSTGQPSRRTILVSQLSGPGLKRWLALRSFSLENNNDNSCFGVGQPFNWQGGSLVRARLNRPGRQSGTGSGERIEVPAHPLTAIWPMPSVKVIIPFVR